MAALSAVFLFCLFLLHHGVTPEISEEEKQALLSFIRQVKHRSDYSWKASDPVCNPKDGVVKWKGVTCDPNGNFVIYLRLPGASLIGEIPPETIGKLQKLRVLSLRFNGLHGALPDDFSNLQGLTKLILNNNNFSGHLPPLNLNKLDVSNNNFNGSIPPSLSIFPATAFSDNTKLCGPPLPRCANDTQSPPPPPPEKRKKETIDKRVIVGVSVGSALLLIILLCCLRKKMNTQMKQPSKLPLQRPASASKGSTSKTTEVVGNKFIRFLDAGIYSFDLEDLYQASPEVLGKGSVGTSYKVAMDGGTTVVVVKRLKDVVVTESRFEATMEVLGKMKKSKHVVPLVAYYYSKDEKLLVYDYMPSGSLYAHLHGSRGLGQTRLDWAHRKRIALSAARGVAYLHVVGKVVHGNIKSSNILLNQETSKDASVSDYGLHALFGGLSSENHQVTTGYQAPEVLKTRQITFETDVYSFGILLFELLTGKDPNQASLGKEGIEAFDVEFRGHQNIKEEMVQLLRIAKSCVMFESNQRPTMQKVMMMMEDMNRVEPDEWFIHSSDDHSKPFDDTPSTETRDTPSTITP